MSDFHASIQVHLSFWSVIKTLAMEGMAPHVLLFSWCGHRMIWMSARDLKTLLKKIQGIRRPVCVTLVGAELHYQVLADFLAAD